MLEELKLKMKEDGCEYIMTIKKVYQYDEVHKTYHYDLGQYYLFGKALGNIVLFKLVIGSEIYDVERIEPKKIGVDYNLEYVKVNASYECYTTVWTNESLWGKKTFYFYLPY